MIGTWHRRWPGWLPGLRRHFHDVFRAEPLEIRKTLQELRLFFSSSCDEETLNRTELVMAEILNNIARHGGTGMPAARSRRVRVNVLRRSGGMCCMVMDDGGRVPMTCLQSGALPAMGEGLPEGGFGLYIVRSLVRRMRYWRLRGHNLLMLFVADESGRDA